MKSIKLLAAVAALFAPLSAASAAQGLYGRYYTGPYPAPTTGAPAATFLTNTVCFPNCGVDIGDGTTLSTFLGVPLGYTSNLSQDFNGVGGHSLQLTGKITIASAGTHNFGLYSDDGSLLYIDGKLVVNNGGLHAPQSVNNNVTLTAGDHFIRIYQDENGGGTALTAYYDGNPLSGAILQTAGVPEPAMWGLMIGGFGVVGGASRRRRTMATVTA